MFRKQPPPPPISDHENDENSSEEETEKPQPRARKRDNNQIEKRQSQESDDEVFHPPDPNIEVIEEEKVAEKPKTTSGLRNRRVSYGKIPVPPMPMTVEDIQEAAKNSRENEINSENPPLEKRKSLDPRRSSVSVDVFKGFRDPHDRENIPAKNTTVYVEGTNGKFREMKKGKFWRRNPEPNKNEDVDDEEEESIIPYLLRAPGQAFRTQRAYNQVANIVQGFLAGITVMLAIFSFNLDPDVLLSGYRIMSLPIHAAFYIAFTVGFVSAIDRTGVYEVEHFTSRDRLKATVYNNGLFTFVVWFVGIIATLLCIQLESQLAFAPNQIPTDALVQQWRIFNVFRALSAAFGFLLLAFKPDSDTMAKELRRAIFDYLEKVSHDHENREIVLTAMKIST